MINLLIILPLISFVICNLFGRKIGDSGAKIVSVSSLACSFLLSLVVFKGIFIDMATSFVPLVS